MLGSMGLAASIGIGIAINVPTKPVIIIEGDGNFLMNPTNMFLAGEYALKNLIHIIIDNNMYKSTGGQKILNSQLNIAHLAQLSNYRKCHFITNVEDLEKDIKNAITSLNGPYLFHLKITRDINELYPRVDIKLKEMKDRFMKFLCNYSAKSQKECGNDCG
ncbi:MAG: thiamine pyrophosphate-dependent enzyme [bacterium]